MKLNMSPIREDKYMDWHNSMLIQVKLVSWLPSLSLDYRIPNFSSGSVLKGNKNLPLA